MLSAGVNDPCAVNDQALLLLEKMLCREDMVRGRHLKTVPDRIEAQNKSEAIPPLPLNLLRPETLP